MARRFALHLSLEGESCLVVGGGEVGWRKAKALLDCGARVTVVAERFCLGLQRSRRVTRLARQYRSSDLEGVHLVVAATDDRDLNRRVSEDGCRRGLLVNVVDDPSLGNFVVPAQLSRGRLTVSISTEGSSPLLARKLKERLADLLDDSYGPWLEVLASFRSRALRQLPSVKVRRAFFEELTSEDFHSILKNKGVGAARRCAARLLREFREQETGHGGVG
jgi:precorrin-2 dehydrogenase/sirohydrochlorin ferrochelatase